MFPPGSTQAEVLWRDDNFTAYREKANPVSSKGHIIIAFKCVCRFFPKVLSLTESLQPACSFNIHFGRYNIILPLPSSDCLGIHGQSSSDVPLLVNVRNLATRLLASLIPASTPVSPSTAPPPAPLQDPNNQFRIGFITPPFKDNKIPVTDHLHAHAYIGPADLLGWWRGVAYGPLAWYAIDDLIAEIR